MWSSNTLLKSIKGEVDSLSSRFHWFIGFSVESFGCLGVCDQLTYWPLCVCACVCKGDSCRLYIHIQQNEKYNMIKGTTHMLPTADPIGWNNQSFDLSASVATHVGGWRLMIYVAETLWSHGGFQGNQDIPKTSTSSHIYSVCKLLLENVKATQHKPAPQSPGNINVLLKLGDVASKGFNRKLYGGANMSRLHLDRCLSFNRCCGTSDFIACSHFTWISLQRFLNGSFNELVLPLLFWP